VRPLESSFVQNSFPSGHVAAAAVYGGIAMVVAWHTRSDRLRRGVFVTVAVITVAVALGRLHRGMHHLSDVVAGAVLGVVCVAVVAARLRGYVPEARAARPQPAAALDDGVNVSPA